VGDGRKRGSREISGATVLQHQEKESEGKGAISPKKKTGDIDKQQRVREE